MFSMYIINMTSAGLWKALEYPLFYSLGAVKILSLSMLLGNCCDMACLSVCMCACLGIICLEVY